MSQPPPKRIDIKDPNDVQRLVDGLQFLWAEFNDNQVFTVLTVPDATKGPSNKMIYVSDEAGGSVLAFSDGINWRRVTDRAVIS